MSRNLMTRVVFAPVAMLAMMASMLGVTTTASAASSPPIIPLTPNCVVTLVSGDSATAPPPPTCFDPSGSDQDEFLVPYYLESNGYDVSYVDGQMNPYSSVAPNSTHGASQVIVQSMHYDNAFGGYTNGAAWRLDFGTTVLSVPTPNSYWIEFGECKTVAGITVRGTTAFVRNEIGQDGRYIGSIYPEASANGGAVGVVDTVAATRLYDGSAVGIPLITFQDDKPGLTPGYTYQVKFWLADEGSAAYSGNPKRWLGATQSVVVPKCGTTTTQPGSAASPKATITVVHRGHVFNRVKVVMGSRQATKATMYRVTRDPRRGRTVSQSYTVRCKTVEYRKVRKGTVVTVKFAGKTVRKRI